MDFIVIALSSLCLVLLTVLGWALNRLYQLSLKPQLPAAAAAEAGSANLDELVSMVIALQERSTSSAGVFSREEYGAALLEAACRLTQCDRGALFLWDEKAQALGPAASRGLSGAAAKSQKKPGEGAVGQAFASGQAVISPASADAQEPAVAIPLAAQSKPFGVLALDPSRSGRGPLSAQQIKLLTLLAGEAAVALNNLDLLNDLETFYMELVQTLARAVDSKDAYTHEHSDRAMQKARRLANELKLPPQMARYVEYAALLHDIGKIGIDEAILLKPGKLTPEEYEVMKRHPVIGHQILAPVKHLGPVAQMVLYHQEWFNGQGYPEGLKGDEIPLGARIVAVIDAWDAMTSDRPYRKALGREIATAELRKGSGTQFDPQVVEVFLKLQNREWADEASHAHPRQKAKA